MLAIPPCCDIPKSRLLLPSTCDGSARGSVARGVIIGRPTARDAESGP
jgi:hypothetical protein